MSKHTEAPWRVADAEPIRLKSGCYIQAVFSLSEATYRPARAHGKTAEECQANADLIAAAPEMLDALEDAESFIIGFEDDETQEPLVGILLARIRAAKAKAKGSQA